MRLSVFKIVSLLATALLVTACTTTEIEPVWKRAVAGDGPGDPALISADTMKVANLPKSRSGNRSEYEVFGVRYSVLESARNFTERGVASWYGSKFHGRPTASGEIYDMHHMTAAHKHLPLPTFARVTRIDNGQSIIVKINDRGPFVGDRIIDLSYAAAARLDMLDSGKADVLVEALSDHVPSDQITELPVQVAADMPSQAIQVGAFTDVDNAEALKRQVEGVVHLPIYLDFEQAQQLYRVRIGPLQDLFVVNDALQRLNSAGLSGFPVDSAVR